MRTRTKVVDESFTSDCVTTVFKNGSTYESTAETLYVKTLTQTTQDVVTPNFRKRSAAGEIINSPFNSQKYYVHAGRMNYYRSVQDSRSGEIVIDQGYRPFPSQISYPALLDPLDTSDVIDVAVTASHANIENSLAQLMVTGAEFKKTLIGVVAVMRRSIKTFRAVRELDVQLLRKEVSLREAKNRYLEYRYGLRPIVFDVKNILDAAVATYKGKRSPRQTFRGNSSTSSTRLVPLSWSYVNSYSGANVFYEGMAKLATKASARAGVLTNVSPVRNISSTWGLDDFLESTWELIPFSFIIDWFINVGQSIAALTPELGIAQLASWVTVKTETSMIADELTLHAHGSHEYISQTWNSDVADPRLEKRVSIQRIPNPKLPILPTIKVRLNTLKLLDLIAIFTKFKR